MKQLYIIIYCIHSGKYLPPFSPLLSSGEFKTGQIPVSNYLLINNTTLVEHTQDKAKPFANEECVKYMGQK